MATEAQARAVDQGITLYVLDGLTTHFTPNTSFYSDLDTALQVSRFPGRVRVDRGINASERWDQASQVFSQWGWQEREASLYALGGHIAISGIAKASYSAGPFTGSPAAIGVSGLAWNDDTVHGIMAWGGYFEAARQNNASTIFGVEIDVGEFSNAALTASDPYVHLGQGSFGLLIGSGGSTGSTPTQNALAAIVIEKNTHTFKTGIIFQNDALTGDDGTTGTASAIQMAKGHAIEWFNGGGAKRTVIRSDISGGNGKEFIFGDTTASIGVLGGNTPFIFDYTVANPTDGFRFLAGGSGTGLVEIDATGGDANIDMKLVPRGTGVLQFGTFTATVTAVLGYIQIKDAGGTLRKLAVLT